MQGYISKLKTHYKEPLRIVSKVGKVRPTTRVVDGNKLEVCFDVPSEVQFYGTDSVLDMCRLFALQKVTETGAKVLKFSQEYADAFMKTDVNLPLRDYAQPYDVMFLEFPENFIENHFKRFDKENFFEVKDKPKEAVVWFDYERKILFIEVFLASGAGLCKLMCDPNMELNVSMVSLIDGAAENLNDDDNKVLSYSLRVALNALLTADGTLDLIGYENSDHANKLDEYVKKSKTEDKKFSAILEKQTLPFTVSFNQKTVTYHKSRGNGSDNHTGRVMGPHWRRGHYRFQKFGAGLCETKRIRIAAVYINFHLKPDIDLGSTETEYDMNNPLPEE